MTFADEFKNARTAHGLTQEEAARAIRRSVQTVSRYERGLSTPEWADLTFIAEALDTDLNRLIDAWQETQREQASEGNARAAVDLAVSQHHLLPAEIHFDDEFISPIFRLDSETIRNSGVLEDQSDPAQAKLFSLLLEARESFVQAQRAMASTGVTTYGFASGATVTVNPGETLEEVSQRLGIDPETG
ncbi:helix-turn-helix transcriptional regulator, partial [Stomatohabitans albus]|uniref:helix-turn-helix domain-containing protein n=1 Tax=Stomatohabitans albus TaxID=3110766 RepID=UPI00300CF8C2